MYSIMLCNFGIYCYIFFFLIVIYLINLFISNPYYLYWFIQGMGGVEAHQRHKLGLLRMEDLIKNGVSGSGPPVSSAQELVELLVDFVTRLTAAKRRLLEEPDLYPDGDGPMARSRRKQLCAKLQTVPGKLDHATIVAFTVPK